MDLDPRPIGIVEPFPPIGTAVAPPQIRTQIMNRAAIVRNDEMRIPRGSDTLEAGDEAIVFALSGAVGEVTRLFPS